jgi:hypothetical protein
MNTFTTLQWTLEFAIAAYIIFGAHLLYSEQKKRGLKKEKILQRNQQEKKGHEAHQSSDREQTLGMEGLKTYLAVQAKWLDVQREQQEKKVHETRRSLDREQTLAIESLKTSLAAQGEWLDEIAQKLRLASRDQTYRRRARAQVYVYTSSFPRDDWSTAPLKQRLPKEGAAPEPSRKPRPLPPGPTASRQPQKHHLH